MEPKNIALKSTVDGLTLRGTLYLPDSMSPSSVVQIIPSIGDHRGRYANFCRILLKLNCAIVIVDNRGCGESVSDEVPLGHFADSDGWLTNLQDIHHFSQVIREKFPKVPFYLIGCSFGALIAHSYLKRYEDMLDGVIFVSMPAFSKTIVSSKSVLTALAKIKGPKSKARRIFDYNQVISNPRTDYDWLSYNIDNIDNYTHDSNCGYNFSNAMMLDVIEGMQDVFSRDDWRVLKKNLPLFYCIGQDDPCADVGSGLKNTLNNMTKVGYEVVEAAIYENMRHEILFEREMRVVAKDILVWLKKQMQK